MSALALIAPFAPKAAPTNCSDITDPLPLRHIRSAASSACQPRNRALSHAVAALEFGKRSALVPVGRWASAFASALPAPVLPQRRHLSGDADRWSRPACTSKSQVHSAPISRLLHPSKLVSGMGGFRSFTATAANGQAAPIPDLPSLTPDRGGRP